MPLEIIGKPTELRKQVGGWDHGFQRIGLVPTQTGNRGIVVDEILCLQIIEQIPQRKRRGYEVDGINGIKIMVAPKYTSDITLPSHDDAGAFDKARIVVADDAARAIDEYVPITAVVLLKSFSIV